MFLDEYDVIVVGGGHAGSEAAASAAGASKALTKKALKGKIQAGVQEQVTTFGRRKLGTT